MYCEYCNMPLDKNDMIDGKIELEGFAGPTFNVEKIMISFDKKENTKSINLCSRCLNEILINIMEGWI